MQEQLPLIDRFVLKYAMPTENRISLLNASFFYANLIATYFIMLFLVNGLMDTAQISAMIIFLLATYCAILHTLRPAIMRHCPEEWSNWMKMLLIGSGSLAFFIGCATLLFS